jgi:hypothetical protein
MVTLLHPTFSLHELYYAVFNASRRLAREMPRVMIPQGALVLRSSDATSDNQLGDERTARTIFGGCVDLKQRWSGAQPGGAREPGRGGLAVGLSKSASIEEGLQYTRRGAKSARRAQAARKPDEIAPPDFDEAQREKMFFVFELQRTLAAVDFSESLVERFCARLDGEVDVRHELEQLDLGDLPSALRTLREDFSITRALGNAALMTRGVEALVVTSQHDDYTRVRGASDSRARHAVLAGYDGAPLPYLRPVGRVVYEQFGSVIQLQRRLPL